MACKKKKYRLDGTLRPSVARNRNKRAQSRVHVMGLACAAHSSEANNQLRDHVTRILMDISEAMGVSHRPVRYVLRSGSW